MSRRAFLFANGTPGSLPALAALLRPDDFLIAADAGMAHIRQLGRIPDVLIGDLDSVRASDLEAAQAAGARVLRYPAQKDDTDLELALRLALAEGFTQIRFAAVLGGRVDHLLGNLLLLDQPALRGVDARIEEGTLEALLIREQADLQGAPGDLISLIPLFGAAQGVETENLQYPLHAETLYPYRTRGISNVMLSDRCQVRVADGALLCIHTRQDFLDERSL